MENINLPYCLCGCGKRVSKPKNKFVKHHYIRYKNPMWNKNTSEKVRLKNIGRPKTEEEIEKIRLSCNGKNKGPKNGMYGVTGEDHPCYGKPKSEEHKQKLREKALENDYSGENNPMYGKKHSKKAREKQSKVKKGKSWEERHGKEKAKDMRIFMSQRMCGSNHHNWRGGLTEEGYCEEWRTKDLKEYIKERDNYECQNPQCTNGRRLCIHHINYNKKDCDPWNLITICFSCNSIANFQRDWWESFYKEIIRRKSIYK